MPEEIGYTQMVQAVDPDFEGTLRAVTGDRAAQHTLQLADDLGPLELIRAELPALLGSMQIERMVDLRPLLELGSALVLLNEQPLFVQLHNAPVVVSALAWHPSWSDLPLRPAGPTLIQELLRADLGKHLLETRVAAGPNNLHGGLQGGAVLIQPDAAAAEQTPASTSDIQRLQTAGWSQLLEQASGAAPRDLSGLFVSLLVALIIMESILTRWIDVGVRRTGAQTA